MAARIPIPTELEAKPFTIQAGIDRGVGEKRLRGRDLDRSTWGVRLTAPSTDPLFDLCRKMAVRMPPNAFFSHSTAARLLRIPLPPRFESDRHVHISMPAPTRAPHAAGIRGHSISVLPGQLINVRGLSVTGPTRTWLDLASILRPPDLVAAGDYLIHWRSPMVSLADLADGVDSFRGRGRGRLLYALPHLNERAESRPESLLRLILIGAAFPVPRVNHVIVDTETGKDMRTDFAFDQFKMCLEYQGDYHRTKAQWRKDMTRRSRLESDGWYIMEINADDLRNAPELVARIARVLSQRGWKA